MSYGACGALLTSRIALLDCFIVMVLLYFCHYVVEYLAIEKEYHDTVILLKILLDLAPVIRFTSCVQRNLFSE